MIGELTVGNGLLVLLAILVLLEFYIRLPGTKYDQRVKAVRDTLLKIYQFLRTGKK